MWWQSPDPVGTVPLQINAATGAVTRRWTDPYGNTRGTAVTWSSNLGYLNAPASATGLTQLGARQYDPVLGRFLSVDPVLDVADPRHANAYSYAYNSPVSYSDPSGLIPANKYMLDSGAGYTATGKTGTGNKTPAAAGNKPAGATGGTPTASDTQCLWHDYMCTSGAVTAAATVAPPPSINCATDVKVGTSPGQMAINQACG